MNDTVVVRHTPCVPSEGMAGWSNPWRELRARTHLRLVFAPLPPSAGGGALVDLGGERVIVLDETLGRVDRNAVLCHELIHDERGILYPPGAPPGLVQLEERAVNRIAAAKLVPNGRLSAFVDRLDDLGHPVTARDVAEEFDVPTDIAALALVLLAGERARRSA